LYVFLFFGLLFVFVTPPIEVVDESAHFYRAYQVSELNLVPDNIGQESGGRLPAALLRLVGNAIQAEKTHNFAQATQQDFGLKVVFNDRQNVIFTNTAPYPPINYASQALGIFIARLFTSRALFIFYAGRLANLCFLAVGLFAALRLLPIGKTALMAIGLLPEVLYLGASYSADTFLIVSIALYTAYLLRLLTQQSAITIKQWALIAGLASMVVLAKELYFPLLLPLFAIPFRTRQFNRQDMLKLLAFLAVPALLLVGWFLVLRHVNYQPIALQHSVGIYADPTAQEHFVLRHPLSFIAVVLRTFQNNAVITGFFGALGVGTVPLPLWSLLALALLLFLSFGKYEPTARKFDWRTTALFSLAAGACALLILLVMYIDWANPKQTYIWGIQGRYFIPVLMILIPVLMSRYKHSIRWRTVFIGLTSLLAVSIGLLVRYFYL
jgi:uncharacterized membrane protein